MPCLWQQCGAEFEEQDGVVGQTVSALGVRVGAGEQAGEKCA